MNPNFCIIIPFYNEESTVIKVAKNLIKTGYPLLFVDDGSTDRSNSLLENLQEAIGGFDILSYTPNKGKGYAMKKGSKWAISQGFEYMLFMDADGQTVIEDIENFLIVARRDEEAKIIIGNRLSHPKRMPKIRLVTNRVMSWIISLLAYQHIIDSQCGFRMVHKDVFAHKLIEDRFGLESEILIKAGRISQKILNCPIKCIYIKERVSKISPLKDTIKFIKMIFKCLIIR